MENKELEKILGELEKPRCPTNLGILRSLKFKEQRKHDEVKPCEIIKFGVGDYTVLYSTKEDRITEWYKNEK